LARKIEVQIVGDSSSLQRALSQSQRSLGSWVKSGAAFGVGLEAVRGGMRLLGDALNSGIHEWQESSKVAAQTAAVIKSTGGAANVTAKQVDALSTSLMKKTGIDDEVIKSGENMLLTFTNIHNEAGKGNDIFNQATRTLIDMSTALGTDASKSAIQLGKALNDPITGLTALRRVGVTFTKAQQDQIKAMAKAGDVMGAQKLILAELNKEFGGSAQAIGKTLPGQLNILRESFNNFAGELVAKAVPSLQRFVDFLNTRLIPAEGFTAKLKVVWEGLNEVGTELFQKIQEQVDIALHGEQKVIADGMTIQINEPIIQIGDWASQFWANLKTQIMAGGGEGADQLSAELRDQLVAALSAVTSGLVSWARAQPGHIARSFRDALNANAIGADLRKWILDPLTMLVGNVNTSAFRVGAAVIQGWRSGAAALVGAVTTVMQSVVTTITQRIPAAASAAANLGVRIVSGVVNGLAGIGTRVLNKLNDIIRFIATTAQNAFAAAVAIGSGIISGILSGLSGLAGRVGNFIGSEVRKGIEAGKALLGIKSPSTVTRDEIGVPLGQGVIDGWSRSSAALPSTMSESIRKAIEKARAQIEASRERLGTAFDGMAARILRAFDAETSAIRTASEQRIDEISQRREMEDLLDRQAQAQERLNQAIAEGGDVAAAQRDLDRATEDIALVDLKKKAEQERIQLDSQNEERRIALEKRLEQLKAHFEREGATTKQAMKAITQIMRSFHLDFADAGALLGNAFAQGLNAAINAAVKAAGAVNTAVPGAPSGYGGPNPVPLTSEGLPGSVTVNNYAPISSERDFEDMVRGALANVTGRQGYT
jgi:hypothetical protein